MGLTFRPRAAARNLEESCCILLAVVVPIVLARSVQIRTVRSDHVDTEYKYSRGLPDASLHPDSSGQYVYMVTAYHARYCVVSHPNALLSNLYFLPLTHKQGSSDVDLANCMPKSTETPLQACNGTSARWV